ncbi:hypothetical protein [Streptomyces viridosporus]|uniref:hypothetical protein n=1 Tax=Streptomyces viridosporus TaxID=67581 RepID=UPI0009BD844D|nr:hypothetical protein [Streptomyces viridosporus]
MVDSNSFTGADKVKRNLKFTAIATVPVLVVAIFLLNRGISEAWILIALAAAVWTLLWVRFAGVGTRGLPDQK